MLPRARLELAEECRRMYVTAGESAGNGDAPISPAWLHRLAREVAERDTELTRYELPAEGMIWNFEAMLFLVRWTWRTLESSPPAPPALEYAPWDKSAADLTQIEFNDAMRALAMRWTTMLPERRLWDWVDRLDRRAADLCVRCDLGKAVDEDYHEVDGHRIPKEEFIVDTAAVMGDMMRSRFAHRDFLRRGGPVWRPPSGLPTEGAAAWIEREHERFTPEAREALDGELARFGVRPGEIAKVARSRQGVVPDDKRAVMRQCRPPLSDYRKEMPMLPYLVFGRVCQRRSFDWSSIALLTDHDYFCEAKDTNMRYCDIMFDIEEPTILRIMGADYVYRGSGGEPGAQRAWRCESPTQAICLWIMLVSHHYRLDTVQWDLGFIKDLFVTWRDGEKVTENELFFV